MDWYHLLLDIATFIGAVAVVIPLITALPDYFQRIRTNNINNPTPRIKPPRSTTIPLFQLFRGLSISSTFTKRVIGGIIGFGVGSAIGFVLITNHIYNIAYFISNTTLASIFVGLLFCPFSAALSVHFTNNTVAVAKNGIRASLILTGGMFGLLYGSTTGRAIGIFSGGDNGADLGTIAGSIIGIYLGGLLGYFIGSFIIYHTVAFFVGGSLGIISGVILGAIIQYFDGRVIQYIITLSPTDILHMNNITFCGLVGFVFGYLLIFISIPRNGVAINGQVAPRGRLVNRGIVLSIILVITLLIGFNTVIERDPSHYMGDTSSPVFIAVVTLTPIPTSLPTPISTATAIPTPVLTATAIPTPTPVPTATAIPTPTPVPTVISGPTKSPILAAIPIISKYWSGCIQGRYGPNEAISLQITSETPDGAVTGIYGENYYLVTAIYNEFTQGKWSISDARIKSDNTLQFVTFPVKTYTIIFPFQTTQNYNFKGTFNGGKLTGTVIENNDNITRNWTLNPDDTNTCLY